MKKSNTQISLRKYLIEYRPFIDNTEQLKGIIQGFYKGVFECGGREMDFPKFGWFNDWMQGKLKNNLSGSESWNALAPNNPSRQVALFFKYYEEFSASKAKCFVQKINKNQKNHSHESHGTSWAWISGETNKLIIFTLSGSSQAWCIFMHGNFILHSFSAPNKRALLAKIRNDYFKLMPNWNKVKSDGYLKKLILLNP